MIGFDVESVLVADSKIFNAVEAFSLMFIDKNFFSSQHFFYNQRSYF